MRKLERRAIICLLLAGCLLLGLVLFCFRFVAYGSDWASFPANKHLFADGALDSGAVYDRDGTLLLRNTEDGAIYSEDSAIRRATLHVVGDVEGNISTGAETKFAGKGCVGVYNYETGKIVCAVSSPSYDPNNPVSEATAENDGYYINRLFSATFVPGSIFKTVTSAAVIDNLDYENWSYTCTGSTHIGDDDITCVSAHGEVDFESALSKSCNGAFATLTLELGADTMEDYVDQLGLTKSYSVNGIRTAKGSFTFSEENPAALGWAGVGQSEDLVNPCSMMIYMGAIGNGGRVVVPQIISSVKTSGDFPLNLYIPKPRQKLIDGNTADKLGEMMRNNVINTYGEGNFPGLQICAKSGTAEVGDGTSHSWFAGFLDDPDHPYAFIVLVEHGGSGAKVAGSVANRVLQSVIENE